MLQFRNIVSNWVTPESNVGSVEKLGEFWQIFFAFQYTLFCCPFRVVKACVSDSNSTYSFQAVEWRPQKILCGIFTMTNIFWMQFYIREAIPDNHNNPSEYLNLMSQMNTAILKLSLLKIYWFEQHDILKILNYFGGNNTNSFYIFNAKNRRSWIVAKVFLVLWCTSYPALSVVENILWVKSQTQAGAFWMTTMINMGRKAFFLEYFTSELITLNQSLSTTTAIFSIFIKASHFNQLTFYLHRVILIILPLMTLWAAVNGFIGRLHLEKDKGSHITPAEFSVFVQNVHHCKPSMRWSAVKEDYNELKRLTIMINSLYGLTFTCFVVNTVFYYSTKFSRYIFMELDDAEIIFNFIYIILILCSTFPTFILAGNISLQVSS